MGTKNRCAACDHLPVARQLRLGPLPPSEVQQLLLRAFGATAVSPALLRLVATKSGGNPLACIELAAALRQEGAVRVDEGALNLRSK